MHGMIWVYVNETLYRQ